MLTNACLVAKIGLDTEENEPSNVRSFLLKNTGSYCIESFNLGRTFGERGSGANNVSERLLRAE